MKSIYEAAVSYGREHQGTVNIEDFEAGANYVLEGIENFMKDLDLGNSSEEKFCKLDVLADIGLFIKQLKK